MGYHEWKTRIPNVRTGTRADNAHRGHRHLR